jgi:hypothetical protein
MHASLPKPLALLPLVLRYPQRSNVGYSTLALIQIKVPDDAFSRSARAKR